MLRRFHNFFWCPILRYFLIFFSSETGGVICWFHFWFYQFHLKCEYHGGYALEQVSVEPSSKYQLMESCLTQSCPTSHITFLGRMGLTIKNQEDTCFEKN
jgi:hypothetical protein